MSDQTSDHTRSAEEIEAEIARTREQLADTVDELAARLDVKARARERLRSTPPAVLAGAAAAVVGLVVLVVWRRRR